MHFKKSQRFGTIKKVCGPKVHIEAAIDKDGVARKYCQKEETRLEGPWTYGK
jgi:hypothetical protein